MKIEGTSRNRVPTESELLPWVVCVTAGATIGVTGTFSKFVEGTWCGLNVHIAGWLSFAGGVFGVLLYLSRLKSRLKAHLFILIIFLISVAASVILPFIAVAHNLALRPIYWIAPLILIAHFFHKTVTEQTKHDEANSE
jgi:hypothetical protein